MRPHTSSLIPPSISARASHLVQSALTSTSSRPPFFLRARPQCAVLEHQRLNAIIEELRRANAVEDVKIAHLGSNIRSAESVLQNALDDARPRLAALRRANKRPVDVDEVISYGSKISASMAAPHGWEPNTPLRNHLPPAPTESMMRSGRLAQMTLNEDDGNNNAVDGLDPPP